MGPRHPSRGVGPRRALYRRCNKGFNGSTARKPWCPAAAINGTWRCPSFNGSTARKPWCPSGRVRYATVRILLQWVHGTQAVVAPASKSENNMNLTEVSRGVGKDSRHSIYTGWVRVLTSHCIGLEIRERRSGEKGSLTPGCQRTFGFRKAQRRFCQVGSRGVKKRDKLGHDGHLFISGDEQPHAEVAGMAHVDWDSFDGSTARWPWCRLA